jgi:hypothetical protein
VRGAETARTASASTVQGPALITAGSRSGCRRRRWLKEYTFDMDNIGSAVGNAIVLALGDFIYNNLLYIAYFLILIIFLFLALREVAAWYWKINKIVALLEKIEVNTRKEVVKENS